MAADCGEDWLRLVFLEVAPRAGDADADDAPPPPLPPKKWVDLSIDLGAGGGRAPVCCLIFGVCPSFHRTSLSWDGARDSSPRENHSMAFCFSRPLLFCRSCVPKRLVSTTHTPHEHTTPPAMSHCSSVNYLPVPEVEVVTGFSACREKLSGSPRFALGGIGGADRGPPPPPPLPPPPLPLLALGSAACGCRTAEARVGLNGATTGKVGLEFWRLVAPWRGLKVPLQRRLISRTAAVSRNSTGTSAASCDYSESAGPRKY